MSRVPLPQAYDDSQGPPPPRGWKWRKIIAVTIAAALLLIIIVACTAVLLLRNDSVRQRLIRVARQKVQQEVGVSFDVRDFALHLSGISPSVDMYGVTVHSAPGYDSTPLVEVDHFAAGLQVVSIFRRQWYLSNVRIDHPVARIFVDAKGANNLPEITDSSSSSDSKTDIFHLGIRHMLLDNGEIYYNDRKNALDADLHDLNFQAVFSSLLQQYSGEISYHNGNLRLSGYSPVIHSLDAQFDATRAGLNLKRALLSSGSSQVSFSATLENYAQPSVQARYVATLNTYELRKLAKLDEIPGGIVRLTGDAQYTAASRKPILQALNVDGNISSDKLQVAVPRLKTEIHSFTARYTLRDGNAEVRNFRAAIFGGEIDGQATVEDVTGAQRSTADIDARQIDLAAFRTLAGSSAAAPVDVTGSLNAKISASWTKAMNDLVAQTDATLRADVAPTNSTDSASRSASRVGIVPLSGAIHAKYWGDTQTVFVKDSSINTAATTLTLNGTVSKNSDLEVRLDSRDLHELETIADEFGMIPGGQPIDLSGNATFTASVSGSTADPRVTGRLSANAVHVRQTVWQTIRTNVTVSSQGISLSDGYLRPAERGSVSFNVGVDLNQWAFAKTNPIRIDLNANQFDIAELAKLAEVQTPVTGTLAVNVSLRGTLLDPTGQGTLNLTQATVSGESIQSLNVNFQGTPADLSGTATLQMPAGAAQAKIRYMPKRQSYDAEITANGIHLERLETLAARNAQIAGVLSLTASGSGTIQDPGLQLKAQIPQLKLRDQTVNGVTLQATVAKHVATVALDSQMLNIGLHGSGTINLSGSYETDAKLDTMPIPLEPLVAVYAPSQAGNITGSTEIHATVKGPLEQPAAIDAHFMIPSLSVNYRNTVQVAAENPIQADYTRGVLTVQRTTIHGTGTDLQLEGTVPVTGSAPISLLLMGSADLRLIQLIDSDVTSSGQIQFNINSLGSPTDPNVQGQIKIVNANIALGTAPLGLEGGNGTLNLTNDRLEIKSFGGTVGGGTFTASGNVVYKPSVAFNITTIGSDIHFLYPHGVRETISANLSLTGTTDSSQLRGQVRLDHVSFTNDFDFSSFAGQLGGPSTPPTPSPFAQNVQLSIAVQSTDDVNLVSKQLSLQGAANLRVGGTAADPSILGRINLTGGDLIFMNNRYTLQPSTVEFINPNTIQPVLNVSVSTAVQSYNINMKFRGPVDRLRTDYTSDPFLSETDIIYLLVTGQTTEAGAANPVPGNLTAESAIASQVSGQITNRVQKAVGISQLSVDPVLGCNQQPGACLTVQQRVTSELFVTFATDVTATQNEVVKVDYQATPRLSFSAVRNQNGGFTLDMHIKKRW